eukprot:CAMPEP_0170741514 /NCGR_PEP_ID=MMETSP0437-20130122/6261_1 /TAXON_ID=0 /ORGANISM="Sexangularia sp." /LENGTH=301 /DNA_ID=CAMNT_0011080093 /DNA_START=98 /DNA_END=1003 /DNA_ORIENTATION=-
MSLQTLKRVFSRKSQRGSSFAQSDRGSHRDEGEGVAPLADLPAEHYVIEAFSSAKLLRYVPVFVLRADGTAVFGSCCQEDVDRNPGYHVREFPSAEAFTARIVNEINAFFALPGTEYTIDLPRDFAEGSRASITVNLGSRSKSFTVYNFGSGKEETPHAISHFYTLFEILAGYDSESKRALYPEYRLRDFAYGEEHSAETDRFIGWLDGMRSLQEGPVEEETSSPSTNATTATATADADGDEATTADGGDPVEDAKRPSPVDEGASKSRSASKGRSKSNRKGKEDSGSRKQSRKGTAAAKE